MISLKRGASRPNLTPSMKIETGSKRDLLMVTSPKSHHHLSIQTMGNRPLYNVTAALSLEILSAAGQEDSTAAVDAFEIAKLER